MKIAKRDLALIFVIVGVLAAFCSYKFYFSGVLEDIEKEEKKQDELQVSINEVQARAAEEPTMNAAMDQWAADIEKILGKYDIAYIYEDGILYINKVETDNIAEISSFTVGETSLQSTIEGQGKFAGTIYSKGATSYNFNYSVKSYEELKTFIDYIVSGREGVKALESMNFAPDETTGGFKGDVMMSIYTISDGSKEYKAPVINDIPQGVQNIWGVGNAAPTPAPQPEEEPAA